MAYCLVTIGVGYVGFRREGIRYKRERRIVGETHYNLLGAIKFGVAGILGILLLFVGHFVGLLTPHEVYEALGVSVPAKQLLAVTAGGIFGIICFIGLTILLHRRLADPRIRGTSSPMDIFILCLLWVQLTLGLITIPFSLQHMDGSVMLVLSEWAQRIVTFRSGASELVAEADLLIVVGCKLGEIATKRFAIPSKGKTVIHLDILPEEFGRTYQPTVVLWGDVREGGVVEASGDVVLRGAVQSGTVASGGSIDVGAGVLHGSNVTAVGNITARHATSSRLDAGAVAVAAATAVLLVPPVPGALIAFGRSVDSWSSIKRLLYVAEGATASVAVTEGIGGARQFHIAGKVEASDMDVDMRLERMLGHIPALVHPRPRTVLVVGNGAGITAGALAAVPEPAAPLLACAKKVQATMPDSK